MQLKFKTQEHQTKAVEAVVDCFNGQPYLSGINYRVDPGTNTNYDPDSQIPFMLEQAGFKNNDITLSESNVLNNIRRVQQRHNLNISSKLVTTKASALNLDIEMETGTGKTYCYIKTIFELYKHYGWSKYIIIVPSIAIREGVYKSLQMTSDHFMQHYRDRAKFFIYNSKQLHDIENFSSDSGINIIIINIQAFNSSSKDNRRIYEELDDFQSRKPIDVISANKPILILDEPQKMEGPKTLAALAKFDPLFILRYSATHKTEHNKIYILDALDAYNQKLVKKIVVRGVSVNNLPGKYKYLYLQSVEPARRTPFAIVEMEVKQKSGIKRITAKLKKGDDLHKKSKGLEQYNEFVVSGINVNEGAVEFKNGCKLHVGDATIDDASALRRIQIREAIYAHLEAERPLFDKGIKVLSLFFIDKVAKYRIYHKSEEVKGEYAKIFEEEYMAAIKGHKKRAFLSDEYKKYLNLATVDKIHNGYFSIDKKNNQMINPHTGKRTLETDDVDAYDLILKDKEKLLSFDEPTRFIFSHSALREGWDNPNIFVICTLKHSESSTSRRQEVGRGLRIAVNQHGDRQDDPIDVHETNVLTVVASESYNSFVNGLQKDIRESLTSRPRFANAEYFMGKVLPTKDGDKTISQELANEIEHYLIKNDYIDTKKQITQEYHSAVENQTLIPLPKNLLPHGEHIFKLIDSVYSDAKLIEFADGRKLVVNHINSDNFSKNEFKELWKRINHKAVYNVNFDSSELIEKCIKQLNNNLHVPIITYKIQHGEQVDQVDKEKIKAGQAFVLRDIGSTDVADEKMEANVSYDLIGKVAENTCLTRNTISTILSRIDGKAFAKYKTNPEIFILEASNIIQEQKATVIIEHLCYDPITEKHDIAIFTNGQSKVELNKVIGPMKKHVYEYVVPESKNEEIFADKIDKSAEVVVYAKLPRGFYIPTPVGNYNPDWAITFKEGTVKHIYFVAETKGSLLSMQLRNIENTKINCAKKFFDKINSKIKPHSVIYDVVDGYDKLMEIVR